MESDSNSIRSSFFCFCLFSVDWSSWFAWPARASPPCQRSDSVSLLCRTWRGLRSSPAKPKLRRAQEEEEDKVPKIKKGIIWVLGAWNLRCLWILLWIWDLSPLKRNGKPRFRPAAPPPDGAERSGSQRRVSDGAGRTRLRAAPRSLSAREILLISPLHGSALRLVANGIHDKWRF